MDITPYSSVAPKENFCQFTHNTDLQSIIFDFIGVNEDLARCRAVSRDWNKYVQVYSEAVFKKRKQDIEKLKPQWESLQRSISPATEEIIEAAEVRKVVYESFDKNVFYRSIRALAKINCPSECTYDGVIAVMHLLIDEEELASIEENMEWKYFRKKMLNRNFLKFLRNIQPEDISAEKISRFEAAIGMEMVTEYNALYASQETRELYNWAMNMVEYKEFLDTLSPEIKEIIRLLETQKKIQKEFEDFGDVVGKIVPHMRR